jgi:hypothetical protein
MKLLGLKSYISGFTGFRETENHYVFFHFSRRGTLRELVRFDKTDFAGPDRFKSVMARFVPLGHFFHTPVVVESLTAQRLARVLKEQNRKRPKGMVETAS